MKQHLKYTDVDLVLAIDRLDELSYHFLNNLLSKHDYSRSDRAFNKATKMADHKALKIVKNTHFMRLNKHLLAFKYRTANGEYCCTTKNHLKNDSWPVNIYKMILVYRHIVESNNSGMMTFDK